MPIYYHVAGLGFRGDEPLLCWDRLYDLGYFENYDYRWSEAGYSYKEMVSLFSTLNEAKEFAEMYGGRIARVTLDEPVHTRDLDGHPSVYELIPEEFVELIPDLVYEEVSAVHHQNWEYEIAEELPTQPDDGSLEIDLRVFETSVETFCYCADNGHNDFGADTDEYATSYRATKAGIEDYRAKGYRIRCVTIDADEKAACELGVPVRWNDKYLISTRMLDGFNCGSK